MQLKTFLYIEQQNTQGTKPPLNHRLGKQGPIGEHNRSKADSKETDFATTMVQDDDGLTLVKNRRAKMKAWMETRQYHQEGNPTSTPCHKRDEQANKQMDLIY